MFFTGRNIIHFVEVEGKPNSAVKEGMDKYDWPLEFRKVYDAGTERYRKGERKPEKLLSRDELAFLRSIGCTAQELYDFIDDLARYGEPAFETVLLTTSVRRDYFLIEQDGRWEEKQISMDDLPAKKDEVDGSAWLPRLIEKARAQLRGTMPPDLMYGCGGDRPFLREMNVELSEFLSLVWCAGDDNRRIINYVKQKRDGKQPSLFSA